MNIDTDNLPVNRTEKQLKLLIRLVEYAKKEFLEYTYNYPNYPADCITTYIRKAGLFSSLLISIAKEFKLYDNEKIERIVNAKGDRDRIRNVTWFYEVYDILPELNPIFCESNNKWVLEAYIEKNKNNYVYTVYGKNWHEEIKGTELDSTKTINDFKLKIFNKLIKKLKKDLKLLNIDYKKEFYLKNEAVKKFEELLNNDSVNRIKIYFGGGNSNYLGEAISIDKIDKDKFKIEEYLR